MYNISYIRYSTQQITYIPLKNKKGKYVIHNRYYIRYIAHKYVIYMIYNICKIQDIRSWNHI